MALHNLAKELSTTTGTASAVLSGAVTGYKTFEDADVVDNEVVTYGIHTFNTTTNRLTHSEVGIGTYDADTNTLSRDTVLASSNADAKITMTGVSHVFVIATAEWLAPGLLYSADAAGWYQGAAAVVSYEFDGGSSPLTWSAAVDTESVNAAAYRSKLYIQDNGGTESLGTFSWSPAAAFDIACKVALGTELGTSGSSPSIGLVVGDSAMNNRGMIHLVYNGTNDRFEIAAWTYAAASYTQRGATVTGIGGQVYLRITRDGSNNLSFYWSSDGIMWILMVTQALTFTQAKAGLRMDAASTVTNVTVDWIRTTS
jgi:hypothetical protein